MPQTSTILCQTRELIHLREHDARQAANVLDLCTNATMEDVDKVISYEEQVKWLKNYQAKLISCKTKYVTTNARFQKIKKSILE